MQIQVPSFRSCLTAGILATLLTSCATSPKQPSGEQAAMSPEDSSAVVDKAEDAEAKLLDLRHQVQKAEQTLQHARVSHEVAKLDRWLSKDAAQFEMESARVALGQAIEKAARFQEFERTLQEEGARISLDRSADRLIGAQQDLQGILDIYEQEEEARSRDEIIRRHRMSVSFAERSKEMAATRLRVLTERELPAKGLVLERARVQAERAVQLLEKKQGRKDLEQSQKMSRSEQAIGEAEFALESVHRKLKRAEAKAQDRDSGAIDDHNEEHGTVHDHGTGH